VFRLSLIPASPTPIYRQIVEQVEHAIAAHLLHSGDELPSVRAVAQQQVVNPMTVSKAYALLEAQGLVERRRGRGMFVADRAVMVDRLDMLQPALEQAARVVRQLDIAPADAVAAFERVIADQQRAEHDGDASNDADGRPLTEVGNG